MLSFKFHQILHSTIQKSQRAIQCFVGRVKNVWRQKTRQFVNVSRSVRTNRNLCAEVTEHIYKRTRTNVYSSDRHA